MVLTPGKCQSSQRHCYLVDDFIPLDIKNATTISFSREDVVGAENYQ